MAGAASAATVLALAWPMGRGATTTSSPVAGPIDVSRSADVNPRRADSGRERLPGTASPASAFFDDKASGRYAYAEGRLEDALEHFNDALAANPDDHQALNGAGQVLVRLGRSREALPLLERAVELAPGDWEAQFNLARALGESGDWAQAVDIYRRAAGTRPGHYPTMFNLARAMERNGQLDEAIAQYRQAAESSDAEPSVNLSLALACERAKDWSSARAAYVAYLGTVSDQEEMARVRQRLNWLDEREASGASFASK